MIVENDLFGWQDTVNYGEKYLHQLRKRLNYVTFLWDETFFDIHCLAYKVIWKDRNLTICTGTPQNSGNKHLKFRVQGCSGTGRVISS